MPHRKLFLLLALLCTPVSLPSQTLLPMPRRVEWHEGTFAMNRDYGFIAASANVLDMAKEAGFDEDKAEAVANMDGKGAKGCFVFRRLEPKGADEAYNLCVDKDTITVEASTVAGFRYALATLKQLELSDGQIACCTINDSPAMAWRGAMIDVSRHFMPIEFLYKQIDLMASFKLNRLHLHLTDAAGWRMEIKAYPRLTQLAAWRSDSSWKKWWHGSRQYAEEGSANAHGGYYTQQELRRLVAYAEKKGIVIVPEIEMPAHSEEVLTAYPELSCTHEPYLQADFCPGNEQTYQFLEQVLSEVIDVFPSTDIHIGGDEAGKASWRNCPLCKQRMEAEGYRSTDELQGYLVRRIAQFLKIHGRRMLAWHEVMADSMPHDATLMVWGDTAIAHKAIRLGHDVVLSPGKYCYLDAYQDDPTTLPEAMGGFLPLSEVYAYRPTQGFSDSEIQHIRGIQANLWTEYVPTPKDAERQLWPRLLAIAETAWSGDDKKDSVDFRRRAIATTAQLRSMGVAAFDISHEIGDREVSLSLVKHKARGATVVYNAPYNSRYCAAGESALTDGRRGGWNYGPGSAWQGFISSGRMDVTIDLGRMRKLHQISTNFFQSSGPEIFLPAMFIISISDDGKSFEEIYECNQTVERLSNPSVEIQSWTGSIRTRYVRLQALSGEYGGWIFADEVEMY